MNDLVVRGVAGPVRVVYVPKDRSGEDGQSGKDAVVIFYDARSAFKRMGDYYVQDILEGSEGLNLNMGNSDWRIDKKNMDLVREWIIDLETFTEKKTK
jgi:hypothetical protein